MTKKQIKFNISASSYSVFNDSPLQFYYQYITKEKPDTQTIQCYGLAGNVVHNILEKYSEDNTINWEKLFEESWNKKNLNTLPDLRGNPLDIMDYFNALKYGIKLIDKLYIPIESELKIEIPFFERDNVKIGLKGFIDLMCKDKKDNLIILDWKTNNSKTDFSNHAKMYFLLYWKKYNIFPDKAVYEYLKLGSSTIYSFTKEEILEFEKELLSFCENIYKWQFNKKKYELGDFNGIFNNHKQKCYQEMLRRENKIPINVKLKDNFLWFDNSLPEKLRRIITLKYSYTKDGVFFSPKYKSGQWDGRKYFFRKNRLPYAFVNNLRELISDYNDRFNTNYDLVVEDLRDKDITSVIYETQFKDSDIILRYYQVDAINRALMKEVGILALGCSAGKTIIAADLIKKLNRRTLFLVNRLELAEQTKEELENYLGVEVGLMTEGNLVVKNQTIVASIQTIYAILKRKNEKSEKLKEYLFNVTAVIADEIQNVKNSGYYKSIYDNTKNLVYCIGLSGSPFRNQGDTLEMNSLIGFPIYWKTNEELTNEGYLCPSKCLFIKHNEKNYNDVYPSAYKEYIVENENRNNVIKDIVEKYRKNKKILILTRQIKHAKILNEMIDNTIVITGNTPKKKRNDNYERFKNNENIVLIGSTKIFSAGINIPDLDIIINTTAHKSSIDSIQIVGRVKRKSEGKTMGYYIDFDDKGKFFEDAVKERINILEKWGEDVKVVKSLDGEIE